MSEATPPAGGQAPQVQVQVRDDKAHSSYSNVNRVIIGPQADEVIVELGVMLHDPARQDQLLMEISTRSFMSVYAAKKLALQLSQTVQRYEAQFGPIELDPRRRMKQG